VRLPHWPGARSLVSSGHPRPESTGAAWRRWLSEWRDYRAEAVEFKALDGQRVLVLGRMSGRGRSSDAAGETAIVNVFHIRDGTVIKLVLYSNCDRALADLGLEE
jgi:hypothetical protein